MAIFDELKSIGKVLQEAGKIEQYRQILDAQQKLLEMQNMIYKLDAENRRLKEKIELNAQPLFEKNTYWIVDGGEKRGPYCTKCKDVDDLMARLREGRYALGWALCPNCNKCAPR